MNDLRPVTDREPPDAALDRLRTHLAQVDRTERLPVSTAVGRPLAEPVVARRPVPHYDQVTRDGFAVRADDTTGATASCPAVLPVGDRVDGGRAVAVDAGDELPTGADAVVGAGATADGGPALDTVSEPAGDESDLTVAESAEPGDGVCERGADVAVDEPVRPAAHRLRRSDPALCGAVGRTRVEVVQRPAVGVVPTGHGVVGGDPAAGETVETNGTTVAEYVEGWGGKVTYRDAVATDRYALRAAVERDLTKDLLVTVGGTGAGEFDRVAGVLADLGAVLVDGVALDPGGTARLAVVRDRPVVALPGDPVAAFVAMTRFVGPAVTTLAGRPTPTPDTAVAALSDPLESERDVQSVVPVAFEDDEPPHNGTDPVTSPDGGDPLYVRPVSDEPLSTLARADGWVAVPPERARLPANSSVTVERWVADR